MGLADWTLKLFGESSDGFKDDPPGSHRHLRFGPPADKAGTGHLYVAETHNDGFELWIGYEDRWLFHCRQSDARRLAWFVLWECWAKGTWFGLRRWLWYRALRVVVRGYTQESPSP